jgi:hypothetical protein
MSIATNGGFSGDNALLAFAAIQQGRMNDELSESMRRADVRSQMAQDVADIKAHLEQANRGVDKFPEGFPNLDAELSAFMEKYGDEPACADMIDTVKIVADSVHLHVQEHNEDLSKAAAQFAADHGKWAATGKHGAEPTMPPLAWKAYEDKDIETMITYLQDTIDASGTNDQLAMIHLKQLNDNINNSSGMVSGIIESRQNALASIVNNLA